MPRLPTATGINRIFVLGALDRGIFGCKRYRVSGLSRDRIRLSRQARLAGVNRGRGLLRFRSIRLESMDGRASGDDGGQEDSKGVRNTLENRSAGFSLKAGGLEIARGCFFDGGGQ